VFRSDQPVLRSRVEQEQRKLLASHAPDWFLPTNHDNVMAGLLANQPHPERAEELMTFGQFVGGWDMSVQFYDPAGACTFDGVGYGTSAGCSTAAPSRTCSTTASRIPFHAPPTTGSSVRPFDTSTRSRRPGSSPGSGRSLASASSSAAASKETGRSNCREQTSVGAPCDGASLESPHSPSPGPAKPELTVARGESNRR
jgi:hypothetical protein